MTGKEDLLVQIAELYYQQEMNQAEIAKLFGLSRPSVSRFLEDARQKRIVEVIVHSPVIKNTELSAKMKETFGLKFCGVVDGELPYSDALRKCARAAGNFLHSILANNMTIAVAWGTAMGLFAEELESREYYNLHVAQTVGCLGAANNQQDGIEISRIIAKKLGASYSNIYAPVFVDSAIIQEYFLKETYIATAMRKAMYADIFLSGIGSMGDPNSVLSMTGHMSPEEWDKLEKRDCVAHLMARMFDGNGNEICLENKHVIAAPLERLREANWSIGIAASAEKAASVLGTIRAGYINCLFIDTPMARALLSCM